VADKDRTLEYLCRPLSGKVMPARAKFGPGGRVMSDTVATAAQRLMRKPAPGKARKTRRE
jgi:hypothetical protein